MVLFWLKPAEAISLILRKKSKAIGSPPNCPRHRVIQGVSENGHTGWQKATKVPLYCSLGSKNWRGLLKGDDLVSVTVRTPKPKHIKQGLLKVTWNSLPAAQTRFIWPLHYQCRSNISRITTPRRQTPNLNSTLQWPSHGPNL